MRAFACIRQSPGLLSPIRIAVLTLAFSILFTACGASAQSRSPLHGTNSSRPINVQANPTLPPAGSPYSQFRGIFQFQGTDDPANASSPYLAGANICFYWSQLEPVQGQYDWSLLDRAMQSWIIHGKKVILRISTSGWAHWQPPYSAHGTPRWVYDAGVPSVTEIDGAVFPQYWHPFFLSSLSTFVQALARRYDGDHSIAYIQIGVGVGGETKVDTEGKINPNILQLWQRIGYTDAVWWQAVQKIVSIYTANFRSTPLALMPDATFIGNNHNYQEALVLNYAVQHHIWLQDNGLVMNRTLPSIWMTVPHTEEQLASTQQTGDSLWSDMQAALELQARYILVFTSDIQNPANRQALQWAAHFASS